MTNILFHKATKRNILSRLTLCALVSLSSTLKATTSIERLDTRESYDYTLKKALDKGQPITEETNLHIEKMPQELVNILNNMPITHDPFPQLLALVTYDPTTQYYGKYLFASSGLLTGRLAQQTAHRFNYHLIESPPSPVLWQVLSFLGQHPDLEVNECILPKDAPLCLQCGHIATHLLDQDIIMKKDGCQGQSWLAIPPTPAMVKAFYSSRFSDEERQMTISPVGDIFAKKTFLNPTQPVQLNLMDQYNSNPISPLKPATLLADQLLIPANGLCLYSTIIMGYLLPVTQEVDELTERMYELFSDSVNQDALIQLNKTLQSPTRYLLYLRSEAFNTLVTNFMTHMKIRKGTWGGPQEIQTIADKLKINIREYYPDPSNRTTLLKSDFTKPAGTSSYITLHIVRDKVHPTEVLTKTEQESAKDNPYYQHYRLKYTSPLSTSAPTLPLQQRSISLQRELKRKSSINPYVTEWVKAAKKGNRKRLEELYNNYNIDINTKGKDGKTALLWSAEKGHLDCLKFLLEKSADIHAKSKRGSTALPLSAEKGHLDCVKYLLQQGADIHDRNKSGNTALLLSTKKGHLDCVKYLLQQGADINNKNKYRNTPLLLSAQNGYLDCVRYLVQEGTDINMKNTKGNTPLILSASKGHLACVKFFIQEGADIHAKNTHKNTALQLSAQNEHIDCVNFILTSVDVRNLDLTGIDLSQATLPKDLSNTNLTKAKLPKDLSAHNLTSANLSHTDLTYVNLPKDLSNTNLIHANLTGQRFTAINFEGTQLANAILTDTECDYQECFQDHIKANNLSGSGAWYCTKLPEDLKSIALVYPLLSQDSDKAALLQIASGLAYLPYWEGTEFYIKVHYWSCKLLLLKKKIGGKLGEQLICALADNLAHDAKQYCWKTKYPQDQVKKETESPPHKSFDKYAKSFQTGVKKYPCQSNYSQGYAWYKDNIEKSIQGLKTTYSKLTKKKNRKEAVDIAFQLSTLYQHQHLNFLFRYLSLQKKLIHLKLSAGIEVGEQIHYNKKYGSSSTAWCKFK